MAFTPFLYRPSYRMKIAQAVWIASPILLRPKCFAVNVIVHWTGPSPRAAQFLCLTGTSWQTASPASANEFSTKCSAHNCLFLTSHLTALNLCFIRAIQLLGKLTDSSNLLLSQHYLLTQIHHPKHSVWLAAVESMPKHQELMENICCCNSFE